MKFHASLTVAVLVLLSIGGMVAAALLLFQARDCLPLMNPEGGWPSKLLRHVNQDFYWRQKLKEARLRKPFNCSWIAPNLGNLHPQASAELSLPNTYYLVYAMVSLARADM
jgi:hypothetical protein